MDAQDLRRQKLIAAVLDDFSQLSGEREAPTRRIDSSSRRARGRASQAERAISRHGKKFRWTRKTALTSPWSEMV